MKHAWKYRDLKLEGNSDSAGGTLSYKKSYRGSTAYAEKKSLYHMVSNLCEDCTRMKCTSGCICDCHPKHWW
ncbi:MULTISPECIES: hypothetical protein [Nitrosopumilus]|uniref:Uncharacterized protein n=1 Tax=Nitrosopumilus piranensis TaxID=1582439 RepID=A0A0C5BX85_9ARCH|nr:MULTISPECIES: hypothetical protein [Nitrosopumilus]AJM92889.1 hypothetical protein NPIRD3C_1677 [Nitrosopumilus piranensis]KAF6244692.1 hypothetical protein C6989_07430 [Nitrosopumilus sp. b2]